MPSVINRVPPGLLSLLDIKAQGENPRFLGDQVTPTFDFWQLYEIEKREPRASAVVGSGTVGLKATIQVPNNEYWHVLQMSSAATSIAAGEIAAFCCYYFGNVMAGAYFEGPVGPYYRTIGTAGEVPRTYATSPFWAGPGELIGTHHAEMIGAAVDLQTRALIVRYPL